MKTKPTNATKKPTAQQTTPTPVVLPKKLVETASKIRGLQHEASGDEFAVRYKIAELVVATQADAKYGDNALALLAGQLKDVGFTSKTLANHAQVARVFPKKKYDELSKLRGGTKEKPTRLSWTHVVTLAGKAKDDAHTLKGPNVKRIVDLTLAEGLTDRQMSAKWNELFEPEKVATKSSSAKGGAGDLPGMLHLVREVLANASAFKTSLLAQLEAGDPVPEPLVTDLAMEFQALVDFAADAKELVRRLNRPVGSEPQAPQMTTPVAPEVLQAPAPGQFVPQGLSAQASFVPWAPQVVAGVVQAPTAPMVDPVATKFFQQLQAPAPIPAFNNFAPAAPPTSANGVVLTPSAIHPERAGQSPKPFVLAPGDRQSVLLIGRRPPATTPEEAEEDRLVDEERAKSIAAGKAWKPAPPLVPMGK